MQAGTVLILDFNIEPIFGKIITIFSALDNTYVYIKMFVDVKPDDYYHAWQVREPADIFAKKLLINVSDLPEHEPCVCHTNDDGMFITTRYNV